MPSRRDNKTIDKKCGDLAEKCEVAVHFHYNLRGNVDYVAGADAYHASRRRNLRCRDCAGANAHDVLCAAREGPLPCGKSGDLRIMPQLLFGLL
jgi:hypothetical protein